MRAALPGVPTPAGASRWAARATAQRDRPTRRLRSPARPAAPRPPARAAAGAATRPPQPAPRSAQLHRDGQPMSQHALGRAAQARNHARAALAGALGQTPGPPDSARRGRCAACPAAPSPAQSPARGASGRARGPAHRSSDWPQIAHRHGAARPADRGERPAAPIATARPAPAPFVPAHRPCEKLSYVYSSFLIRNRYLKSRSYADLRRASTVLIIYDILFACILPTTTLFYCSR